MSRLDDKANSYIEKFAKGFIFFAVLGMVALMAAVYLVGQAFQSILK